MAGLLPKWPGISSLLSRIVLATVLVSGTFGWRRSAGDSVEHRFRLCCHRPFADIAHRLGHLAGPGHPSPRYPSVTPKS